MNCIDFHHSTGFLCARSGAVSSNALRAGRESTVSALTRCVFRGMLVMLANNWASAEFLAREGVREKWIVVDFILVIVLLE